MIRQRNAQRGQIQVSSSSERLDGKRLRKKQTVDDEVSIKRDLSTLLSHPK